MPKMAIFEWQQQGKFSLYFSIISMYYFVIKKKSLMKNNRPNKCPVQGAPCADWVSAAGTGGVRKGFPLCCHSVSSLVSHPT